MASPVAAYLTLTKPGITLFIGITAAAGFITASGGWGSPSLFVLTLVATMLMSGGAATLNQVAEHSSDGMMKRTASRPVPSGLVSPRAARMFGWGLSLLGLAVALAFLPALAALFLALSHISYVLLYTPLKRRTPYCTLVGAIPGALPVLAGWAATGRPIGVSALALTCVLFMWQIPHFLSIGWIARKDYRSAGCPMLAVIDPSGGSSARISLVYAAGMVIAASILAVDAAAGPIYVGAVVITGGVYVTLASSFARRCEIAPARRLFLSSLVVLPLLLGALVTDIIAG